MYGRTAQNKYQMKEKLLGKTPEELREVALEAGLPKFAAGQMAKWLYQKRVRTIDQMTDISKAGRAALNEKYEVGVTPYSQVQVSSDGTRKYLFPVEGVFSRDPGARDGAALIPGGASGDGTVNRAARKEQGAVEAVMIPDGDRATLCVSSQSGCRMGCRFCMTGRQGFHGHLAVADILSQFIAVDESDALTNAVFMGMGEPLDNYWNVSRAITVLTSDWGFGWSPKRITLSTIGVLPYLKRFLDESRCHLAVSLHDPFPDERLSIMPMEKAYGIKDIVSLVRQYDFSGQRRVSFEYTMFAGFNDSIRHADALSRLLRGMECRVNLIRFHKIPDFPYECPSDVIIRRFQERLAANGILTTVRASRGEDILAACGMLAGKFRK